MEPSSYYAVTGTVILINGTRGGIGNLMGNYNLDDRFDGLTCCQELVMAQSVRPTFTTVVRSTDMLPCVSSPKF